MVFSNFPRQNLIAYLKYYDRLILLAEGSNKNNLIEFRKLCLKELQKQENKN